MEVEVAEYSGFAAACPRLAMLDLQTCLGSRSRRQKM